MNFLAPQMGSDHIRATMLARVTCEDLPVYTPKKPADPLVLHMYQLSKINQRKVVLTADKRRPFPIVLLGFGFLATSPAPIDHSVREEVSSGWVKHSRPPPTNHNIMLQIGFRNQTFIL